MGIVRADSDDISECSVHVRDDEDDSDADDGDEGKYDGDADRDTDDGGDEEGDGNADVVGEAWARASEHRS